MFLPVIVAGMMILSACAGAGSDVNATEGVETLIPNTGGTLEPTVGQETLFPTEMMSETATEAVSETPVMTEEPANTAVATMEQPTQSATGVPGIPPTGGDLEALSAMLRYRVVDNAGNELGMVRDYIVNTCEAHILYIVLDARTGSQAVLIPYEAVSLNQNRPDDAAADELVVNFDASLLGSVPTVDLNRVDFESANWDSAVINFWRQNIPISLTSACNVPTGSGTAVPSLVPSLVPGATLSPTLIAPSASPEATEVAPSETPVALSGYSSALLQTTPTAPSTLVPGATQVTGTQVPADRTNVYKLATASDLIGINVVDARNNMVAKVRDALVLKTTGSVYYLIVQLVAGNQQDANGNMVAIPLGAVNLFYGTDWVRSNDNAASPSATAVTGTQAASGTQTPAAPAAGTPDTGKRVDQTPGNSDRPVLVLLVDLSVLQNAPAYSLQNGFVGQDTFDYWSKIIPMTLDALP